MVDLNKFNNEDKSLKERAKETISLIKEQIEYYLAHPTKTISFYKYKEDFKTLETSYLIILNEYSNADYIIGKSEYLQSLLELAINQLNGNTTLEINEKQQYLILKKTLIDITIPMKTFKDDFERRLRYYERGFNVFNR